MPEIYIKENKSTYDWKITAKKFGLPVLTAMILAGGAALIEVLSALNLPVDTTGYFAVGLVIGLIKAGINIYKNWNNTQ